MVRQRRTIHGSVQRKVVAHHFTRLRLHGNIRAMTKAWIEEKQRQQIPQRTAEPGCLFAPRRLGGPRSSPWSSTAELMYANAWSAAEVENEAWPCVETVYLH